MKTSLLLNLCLAVMPGIALSACSVSTETQAKIAEYSATLPTCSSAVDCAAKWSAARAWIVENASFPIRNEDDSRIATFNADSTRSGTAIQVDMVDGPNGNYQILVDVECFAAYGCPNEWDTMLDFNRVVGAATP